MSLQERTDKAYLKPREVERLEGEIRRMEAVLNAPPHIQGQLQDRRKFARKLQEKKMRLERDAPKPYAESEKDAAVKRERELADLIQRGMPGPATMRRNPPGAVDRHMAWEQANKQRIIEWKNLRRRLNVSGDAGFRNLKDVSNVEILRPTGGSNELNMDNAEIPGKDFYIPPVVSIGNVMSDEDREELNLRTLVNLAKNGDEAAAEKLRVDYGIAVGDGTVAVTDAPKPKAKKKAKKAVSPEEAERRRQAGIRLAERAKAARERKAAEAAGAPQE